MNLKEQVLQDELKTDKMLLIEEHFTENIVELIRPRKAASSRMIARRLGIGEGTLSRWRKRFGYTDVRIIRPGPKTLNK